MFGTSKIHTGKATDKTVASIAHTRLTTHRHANAPMKRHPCFGAGVASGLSSVEILDGVEDITESRTTGVDSMYFSCLPPCSMLKWLCKALES